MKNFLKEKVIDLIEQGIGAKSIAQRLSTTEWQIRKIKEELGLKGTIHEIRNVNPIEEDTKPFLNAPKLELPKKTKTYIFTSWEIRVDPSDEFLDILRQMKAHYDAELILVPVWPDDVKYIPPKLQKDFKIVTSDFKINSNLLFKYVPTHALVMSPLTGWKGAFSDSSVIMPGLVKELITEPSNRLSKQLMTTGSVGRLNPSITNYEHLQNYNSKDVSQFNRRWESVINRRLGRNYAIAKEYTVPSALIVNVINDKIFLPRYITMFGEKEVFDLNLKFTVGKKSPENYNPEAFIKADSHVWQGDEQVWEISKDMIKFFNPKYTVVNDFADLISACYHEVDDAAIFSKAPTIEEEAEFTKKKLKEICEISNKVKYNQSNHDNFLIKYLKNEANYRFNYNYAICLELRAWMFRNNRHPIIKLLDLDSIDNLEFVAEDANDIICGTYNIHGHQTVNGRPVGFRALSQIYNRLVMAHSHSPQVWRNSAMVGTTSLLRMNYNKGVSGWLHCNGIVHRDGSIQLLPMIDGYWKL